MITLRGRSQTDVNLFFLCIFCLVARLLWLTSQPGISGDEANVGAMMIELLEGHSINWRVPTGKLLSPIYVALGIPFFSAFSPTFLTLRLPAVFYGLLLVWATWVFTSRLYRRDVALAITLLVACLPMHLVYSRLFIEQSLMGFTAVASIYYAMKGRLVAASLVHLIALVIHPVNIFLTPMLVGCYAHFLYFESKLSIAKKKRYTLWALLGALLSVVGICVYLPERANPAFVLYHLSHPSFFAEYALRFVAILSGVTVIEDFAGALPVFVAAFSNVFVGVLFVLGMFLGVRSMRREANLRGLFLVGSWFASFITFYLFGGLLGVNPGTQRYAMFITVPTLMVVVALWDSFLRARAREKWLLSGSLALGVFYLTLFSVGFLAEFRKTGGRSHEIYQTAEIAPKSVAFEWISAQPEGIPKTLITEDFWLYHPIRFLAKGKPEMSVVQMGIQVRSLEDIKERLQGGGYFIAWARPQTQQLIRQQFDEGRFQILSVPNQAGRPLIDVYQFSPELSSQNLSYRR